MAKIEVSWLGWLPQQQDITLLDIWKMRCGRGKATLTEEEYNTLYSIDPQITKTFSYYVGYPHHPKVVSWKSYKDLCKQVPDVKKLDDADRMAQNSTENHKVTIIPQLCNGAHVSIIPAMESRYKRICFNVRGTFEELLRDYKVSLAENQEWWY